MAARFDTRRINHSACCSDGEGCTNQAESFFSRLHRAEIGVHHHVAGPYLAAYAAEIDWREDSRWVSNGVQYLANAAAAARRPISRNGKDTGSGEQHRKRGLSKRATPRYSAS